MGDIKKLYKYLQSREVQGLGSEEEFKDGFLNDSAFSQRVYDYVKPLFDDIEGTHKEFVDGFREPKNNTAYATPVPYDKKKYYDIGEDYPDLVDKHKTYFGNPPKNIDEAAIGIKKANNMELTPQEKSRERRAKATEHVNANIGVERYNAYKEAEAQYRAAITLRLDADIERAKADKRAKEEEINKTIPQGSRALALFPQAKMAVQWTIPAYTLDVLEDTKELLEAPTKGSNWAGSMWAGFRDNADIKSFLSLGMSTFAKTGKVYDICSRYTNGEKLTDEETNLLEALAMNTAVAGLRAGDISGWYRSGEVTGDMVEIMGQFLLTGGIGTGASKVVSKAIGKTMQKILPKVVSKMGAKGAVGTVLRGVKFAGKGAVDVVAGGAAQSIYMPSTYSGYWEKKSGTVTHGDKDGEYNIEPSKINDLQAMLSSMAETGTERLGGAFVGAGSKILKNIVPKSWAKLSTKGAIGALIKAGGTANKYMAKAGVNSTMGELSEEFAGAAFDKAIGASSDEEWKAFWSKDNMLQMIGGFAPMSMFGLGMNGATIANKRLSALRSKRKFVAFTREVGSKEGVKMAEDILNAPIEDLGNKMHKYTQEIGGYTDGELNDKGVEFNYFAAEMLRKSTERDIADEWDSEIRQEAEDNVNTGDKRTIDDTVDDRVDDTEQTIPQVQQGDEVEYDNARWIVGSIAEEDGEYTFGEESIPLKKGNVLMFEADGNGVRILDSVTDLYTEDNDNGIESRRQEVYEKYRPVMNIDTGNIIQLSSIADNDNIAYVIKGRIVYDEEGNIDYDKSDDTIYYKVYDKEGNEVDGGTPRPLHLKTHRTEFGKVLSDTPIEEYVDNELYPQDETEQSSATGNVSTDEHQGVTSSQNTILSDEEADLLISAMEQNAEAMPAIELTPDNWVAEFGQNGTVSTPIGDVKMGDNQLAKLFLKKRTREFGMIKPTLVNPDVIIEKTSVADNAERNTKLLFVKTFKDESGQKYVHFENVTVQKGGLEVSISSHIVDKSAIRKELANGVVIYNKPELASIGSDGYLTETRDGQSDLVPTQEANSDSQGKGTTNNLNEQEEFYNSLPRNKKGEVDESRMNAEQKIRYAQAEFGQNADLVRDYIAEQSKALSEKISRLTNKTGKSVAEYKELAALQEDKKVFVDYLNEQRQQQEQAMPRRTVEEAAAKREESRREEQAQREQMVREKEEREGVPDFLQDTPENARLRGFRLRTGERIDRQEPIEVSKYNTARRKFTNDTGAVEEGRPTVKRTIIDNAQTRLQPSHRGGRANIYHFITEAQPKERTDKASRVSAAQIAANINPEEITGGITAYNGSPIANNRLEVIQGNNRAEALRLMYEEYPQSAETYKQYLIDNAENYGMSADEVRTMKEPIAVDIYEGTDGNAILLGQYTQQDVESGGVHRINPSGVVKHLKSHNMLDRFITGLLKGVDEENTVSDVIAANLRDVLPILDKTGAISMTQRQGFFDDRGDVTSGAIDDFKGILTSLITEGGYANINSDFLNLPDSAKTALYLQTYRAILNQEYGRQILGEIQDSILLYTLVFGNNNKGKVGVDESRREVMSWLMTAQPDFNTLNEDGTYPLVDMRDKFSNFAAELAILYKSTNLRSSKDKGRGLYTIWDDFYNLLEGKGDLFTAGERKSLQESINENFNIDYVPIRQNERNTLGSRGEASRAGRRGSESELSIGEQSEAGTETADSRGRAEADIAEAVKDIDVEPTEAQKKAGNYKKGHVKIQGFDITIENPKGAIRKGVDDNGKAWSTEMKNHYGYFKNTEGKDGDHIDVFIGDNPNSKRIFVVDQVNPKTKEFDESKVMLGFDTEDEAKKAYLSNYSKDWKGFKDITYVDIDTFRDWLYDGAKQRKPFGEYSNIRLNVAKRKARGATTEKLEELVTLLKKTGFADVKTGEDFYNALAEIEGSERYSQSEKKLYNPRGFITPVRGEWTKEKIKKRLKESGGSLVGYDRAAKLISEFDSPDELAENIFYHGTVYGSGRLKPSILMSDMDVERYGGGGYGDKYWGISVSRSKKIASNFSGTSKSVSILPIVLAKGAKIKEMPDLKDSADIDDVIVDLWKEGVDAVWIGDKNKGEQELCVINPRAIVNINRADTYRVYGLGGEENPINIINKEGIKKLYEDAKQYREQKKIAPKGPLKPFRFYFDENNHIGDKKTDDVYDREMKEYEEQLRVYESSDEYKKWQRAQEYARGNIRFMIGKQATEADDSAMDNIGTFDGKDGDIRYMRPNGTVLGFVKGNTIYLNPDEVSLNTPIHEFGHLWVSQVKEHFPDLWAKGKELFLESDYLRKVQADPNYRHLDLDGQIDEAMARAIGDRGEQELDKTLLEKILDWIAEVWEKIGGVFGIDNLTSEQISNLTLQDFTDMATSELLSGQNLTERVNGNRGGTTRYNTADETADIKAKAIADGTFMKAPNGKDTNLTERQWLQVRTEAFKKWFGDWEKTARIEKLKKTKPIEITGDEVKPSDDLKEYKKNALEYGKTLQGEYTNKDTGITIQLQRGRKNGGLNEVLQHDYKDREHLQSIAAIPQIIENATYIDSEPNNDIPKNPDVKEYQYYVCGLKIGGEDYTVRAVVAVDNKGDRYYDHKLTNIEKGKLLDQINSQAIKNNGFGTTPGTKPTTVVSEYKDSKLISLLQENSSKVVDENGEPMVVYHGTNKFGFTVFDKEFSDDKTSIFFTDRVDIAKGYAGVNADVRSLYDDDTAGGYSKDEILSMLFADVDISSHTNGWDVANDILPYITEDIGITAEYDDEDGVLTLSSDYTGDTYRLTDEEFSWEKVENWLRDNADLENVIDKDAGIYGVFVNARNVLDIDAGGSMWSSIPKKKVKGAEGVGNMDTRDIVEHAKKLNYDGVYIKDLLDTGGRGYGLVGDIEGDIFISLVDKNQIKSATDNIGTFNEEDEDIRYMLVDVQDEKAIDEERRRPKFEIKGEDVYTTMYTTRADTETEIDVLYNGNDFEKALSKAEGYNEDSDREDLTVGVEAVRLKIPIAAIKEEYDYDDEEYDGYVAPFVEDYIDDFVENTDYDRYETGRDMFDVYKSKLDPDENDLIKAVADELWRQTGFSVGKYSTFYITRNGEMTNTEEGKDGEPNAFVSMRIADHTHSRQNGDSTLNIVVADDDPTKTKFQYSKEDLRYTTKDNAEEIVKDILDFWRQYAREYFGDINKQFNDDLDEFERNRLLSSRKFNLGRPSPILMAAGLNGVSIQMTQSVLSKHLDKHNLKTDDLRELPEAIRTPIMVYEWGDKARNSVIVTSIPRGEERITTTIRLTRDGNKLNVNEISSIYGKSAERLIRDINTPKSEFGKDNLRYVDKKQVLDWFAMEAPKASSQTQQELITATKVIENFENPPINEKKVIDDTTNDMVRYSIRANDQLDREDEIMGKKAAEIYEARVKMGKQMNQSNPNLMPNKKIFDEINEKTENRRAKIAEHAADCYLPMKHFIETLNKHGYNIADYNNWYMNVFSLASKNEAEYEKYQAERSVPLQRAAKSAMDSGNISYRELENYLILKHGQERNKYYKERDEKLGVKPMKDYSGTEAVMFEEFCKRTGIEVKTIEEDIPKLVDGDPNMIRYDNGKSEFSKDGKKIPDFEINKRFELWRKQHTPEEIIKDYEEKIGEEKVEDLWSKIRKATQFTLDCQKEGGLTSEKMYEKASGMWEYFVPLRGFDMGTAQDEYDYDLNGITLFTDFRVEQTLGRTRRSVSPLAWTEQMAHITIQQKNKNLLNQSLRRLASVSTARKDNIMFLSKQYKAPDVIENGKVVREGALINPPAHTGNPTEDRAAFERWEASMKEGVKNGTVEVVEHSNVNFGMIVSPDKVKQHVVRVYEGGQPVDIIFNTSPSVPRAINGLNHKAAISNHWIYKNLQAGTRLMAQTMTTLNPAFVGKNFTRDYLFANTMLLGREDMSYATNFNKNIVKAGSVMFDYVRGKSLLGWAAGDKGSVRDNEYGRLLTEFVMNGGKTGFSQMLKFEKMSSDFKKQTEKGDKKVHYGVNDYIHFIEAANDYAENITRFAAYCTSRQAGRSIERSISDAKELTINFNRKGTDGGIWGTVRSLCAFSNASIQALVVFSRGVKANPKRMSAFISGYTAMAITMAVIARLIGGDDDDYFKLSKYDRQNNLCLPMFGGGFVKIPLPQELRVFWKLGDEIALCIYRNEPPEVAAQEVFMGALDLLPSFAAGATSISDVLDEKIGAGELLLAHQPITIIQPATQLMTNRNFLNYRIYDDNKWGGRRKELPEYRKALRNKGGETYSPNFVVKLSEGISRLTGGSDLKRGAVEVNPDVINHLMRGYFGGLYSSAVAAINMGDKGVQSIAAGEWRLKSTDSPTMKAFYVSPSNLRYTDDILNARYMDVLKEAKKHADVYANYLKEGEVDRFEKETKMTEDEALDWRYLVKTIDKEVQELRNEIATAETTKERDEVLRQLEALQREAIDMAAKLKK
nr:MAG TPA: Type I restriction enzyme [Caudoviricetes sp.]